jgi:hypothetical protein
MVVPAGAPRKLAAAFPPPTRRFLPSPTSLPPAMPPRPAGSPCYYLASALAAHVDQGPLWRAHDAAVAAAIDAEGGVELADPATKLCGFTSFAHAWGLPHVLRIASREGEAACRLQHACRYPAPASAAHAVTGMALLVTGIARLTLVTKPWHPTDTQELPCCMMCSLTACQTPSFPGPCPSARATMAAPFRCWRRSR